MRKARIRYDEENDMFMLELNTGDGWELSFGTKCERAAGDENDSVPMMVHCGILMKLREAIDYGYKLVN